MGCGEEWRWRGRDDSGFLAWVPCSRALREWAGGGRGSGKKQWAPLRRAHDTLGKHCPKETGENFHHSAVAGWYSVFLCTLVGARSRRPESAGSVLADV